MKTAVRLIERGLVPDALVRWGIRRLLQQRLREQRARHAPDRDAALARWLDEMRRSPVALVPEKANDQHYEVPAAFYRIVLGGHLKYSACQWEPDTRELTDAESAMLRLTCERAGLANGMRVLELGCGWGSLTLWMAEHFPKCRIVAVSNSTSQRRFILARAGERGLTNIEVLTADMNTFDTQRRFDRVVSVEMFEHMRNWEELLGRVGRWLAPEGRLFVHVFAHKDFAYPFEVRDASDWMSEHFFSGGMMPSDDLMERVSSPLEVERHWVQDGTHYARTAEAWLANLEAQRERALAILATTYGHDEAGRWLQRWRVFFLACAELFAYAEGTQWWVSHYLLRPRAAESGT